MVARFSVCLQVFTRRPQNRTVIWQIGRQMPLKLLDPFIVRADLSHRHDHWQGGSPIHDGATCLQCDHPLLLFWNLDCSDPRFVSKQGRPIFEGLDRLALYWCVTCFASIDYVLSDTGNVRVLCVNGKAASDVTKTKPRPKFPYANFPTQFQQTAIDLFLLSELPKTILDLLTAEPVPKLTEKRKRLLETHVGHSVSERGFDLMRTWVHQFGGKPHLPQGDTQICCQNTDCKSFGKRMNIVAAIRNDPPGGLPIVETLEEVKKSPTGYFNFFVTVYFHVCKRCNSIHVHSQGT